jgi:hypothetical protein
MERRESHDDVRILDAVDGGDNGSLYSRGRNGPGDSVESHTWRCYLQCADFIADNPLQYAPRFDEGRMHALRSDARTVPYVRGHHPPFFLLMFTGAQIILNSLLTVVLPLQRNDLTHFCSP